MTIAIFPSRTGVDGTGPIILAQSGVPICIAPTGTMAANGAVTLGTALGSALTALWMYFPSGAVFSGSAAGFYFTAMSNTTVGTVYTNTYTPGTNSYDIPASPTAVSAAGPGAYTGVTSEVTAVSLVLPGGLMGKNGSLSAVILTDINSNANAKSYALKFGNTTIKNVSLANTNASQQFIQVTNRGAAAKQVGFTPAQTSGFATATSPLVYSTEDTSANVTVVVTLTHTAATDYVTLSAHTIIVNPL